MGTLLLFVKVSLLTTSMLFVAPLMFFLLAGTFGRQFALTIEKDSWVARTRIKSIRSIFKKFLV